MESRTVTGVTGSPRLFLSWLVMSASGTGSILARRLSSAYWPCLGRSAGQICTAGALAFSTRPRPQRSSIGPRGASVRITRSWLFCAATRYWFPDSTCSAQSRKKRTAKAASVRKPRIPIRKTSCGVSRYGASTRGSRGRKRPGRIGTGRLANELDLRRPRGGREQAPDQCEDRQRQQEVERDRPGQLLDQDDLGRSGLPEEEVHDERPDRVEHGHDRDGQERRVRAVASRRLAVAPDPEPGEREQERREAERAEPRDVEQQARPEAGDRAEDRALRERDRDEGDEHEVGRAAEDSDLGHDRHLEDRHEEEEDCCFRGGGDHGICGRGLWLASTSTYWSDEKSTNGITWTSWNGSTSVWPTL